MDRSACVAASVATGSTNSPSNPSAATVLSLLIASAGSNVHHKAAANDTLPAASAPIHTMRNTPCRRAMRRRPFLACKTPTATSSSASVLLRPTAAAVQGHPTPLPCAGAIIQGDDGAALRTCALRLG